MKFNPNRRLSPAFRSALTAGTALAVSVAVGLGIAACSRDYTAAYVYVTSATAGTVSAYAVDYQNGVLTQLNGSPFASQLTNPTTLVAAPNGKFIYVIGGTQNSEVEEFGVGSDGKLYGQHTYNLAANGTYPTAAAIDSAGAYLYVTYTYQNGYTPASPGPGGVSIFPINSDNSLGTPTNLNVGNNPVGIYVAAPTCTATPVIASNVKCTAGGTENVFVYVVDQETRLAAPTVLGYAQNTGNGALTPTAQTVTQTISGTSTLQGVHAGVTPSAIAIDPTGRYVYVTDKTSNEIFGYGIATTTTGNLTPLVSSPYTTGLYPVALTIDPRGKYLYTANYNSNTVTGYSLNSADGSLGTTAAGTGNFSTATGPTCVTVDPAVGIYLYTSNYLDGSISGGQLSPNTGGLTAIANTPFPANTLPSCITSVANGSHSSSLVNP
jgi:6-phosphogluconolactonase (cycloisomerase 2 family)